MPMEGQQSYYVYVLRCADDSYYVGYAEDVEQRLKVHSEGRQAFLQEASLILNPSAAAGHLLFVLTLRSSRGVIQKIGGADHGGLHRQIH